MPPPVPKARPNRPRAASGGPSPSSERSDSAEPQRRRGGSVRPPRPASMAIPAKTTSDTQAVTEEQQPRDNRPPTIYVDTVTGPPPVNNRPPTIYVDTVTGPRTVKPGMTASGAESPEAPSAGAPPLRARPKRHPPGFSPTEDVPYQLKKQPSGNGEVDSYDEEDLYEPIVHTRSPPPHGAASTPPVVSVTGDESNAHAVDTPTIEVTTVTETPKSRPVSGSYQPVAGFRELSNDDQITLMKMVKNGAPEEEVFQMADKLYHKAQHQQEDGNTADTAGRGRTGTLAQSLAKMFHKRGRSASQSSTTATSPGPPATVTTATATASDDTAPTQPPPPFALKPTTKQSPNDPAAAAPKVVPFQGVSNSVPDTADGGGRMYEYYETPVEGLPGRRDSDAEPAPPPRPNQPKPAEERPKSNVQLDNTDYALPEITHPGEEDYELPEMYDRTGSDTSLPAAAVPAKASSEESIPPEDIDERYEDVDFKHPPVQPPPLTKRYTLHELKLRDGVVSREDSDDPEAQYESY
eukprot:m.76853 g.76853  ORF g.76853 m.76853 type:complete len:522 (-) comp9092_c0_seq2:184-1749(-)